MISSISLLVKESKIYVLKSTQNIFFPQDFFNVDSSFNIENRLLKFSVGIIDILMEETVAEMSILNIHRPIYLLSDII